MQNHFVSSGKRSERSTFDQLFCALSAVPSSTKGRDHRPSTQAPGATQRCVYRDLTDRMIIVIVNCSCLEVSAPAAKKRCTNTSQGRRVTCPEPEDSPECGTRPTSSLLSVDPAGWSPLWRNSKCRTHFHVCVRSNVLLWTTRPVRSLLVILPPSSPPSGARTTPTPIYHLQHPGSWRHHLCHP